MWFGNREGTDRGSASRSDVGTEKRVKCHSALLGCDDISAGHRAAVRFNSHPETNERCRFQNGRSFRHRFEKPSRLGITNTESSVHRRGLVWKGQFPPSPFHSSAWSWNPKNETDGYKGRWLFRDASGRQLFFVFRPPERPATCDEPPKLKQKTSILCLSQDLRRCQVPDFQGKPCRRL